MSRPRDVWKLHARHIGRHVLLFETLGSTNDLALAMGEPGLAIVADVQTAGRGQHGRQWTSQAGQSLLLSVCLDPPEQVRPAALIAFAAVAVATTIQELTGQFACIKWPNDLLLQGKKVCGILTERRKLAVVGIGLNLLQSAEQFESDGLSEATSIAAATGSTPPRDEVLKLLLRRLDEQYACLLDDARALEADWIKRIGMLGRDVSAVLADGVILNGRLKEMSFEAIALETADGLQTLPPERIRQLRPAGDSLARGPAEPMIPETRTPRPQ